MLFGDPRIIHFGEVGLPGVDRCGDGVHLALGLMSACMNTA
jgi:hypothetical protein